MTDATLTLSNPLHDIVIQLRKLCRDGEFSVSDADAGSVERIATHITNIGISVVASTQDHVNASKRLNDFASALARIARKSTPPDEAFNDRMALIGLNLRELGGQLAEGDRIPEWAASAAYR